MARTLLTHDPTYLGRDDLFVDDEHAAFAGRLHDIQITDVQAVQGVRAVKSFSADVPRSQSGAAGRRGDAELACDERRSKTARA